MKIIMEIDKEEVFNENNSIMNDILHATGFKLRNTAIRDAKIVTIYEHDSSTIDSKYHNAKNKYEEK